MPKLRESKEIYMVSGDNQEFVLDRKFASMSSLLTQMMETAPDENKLQIPNVGGVALGLVVRYVNRHEGGSYNPTSEIQTPLKSSLMDELAVDLDVLLVNNLGQADLCALTKAAQIMGIPPLLDLCCAKIACIIKGNTSEGIRTYFKIAQDMDEDTLEAVQENNAWTRDEY